MYRLEIVEFGSVYSKGYWIRKIGIRLNLKRNLGSNRRTERVRPRAGRRPTTRDRTRNCLLKEETVVLIALAKDIANFAIRHGTAFKDAVEPPKGVSTVPGLIRKNGFEGSEGFLLNFMAELHTRSYLLVLLFGQRS